MAEHHEAVSVQVDAYAGPEIAKRALAAGEGKARLPFFATFILGILAGAYIALGSDFFTIVTTGNPGLGFGVGRLLGGLAFSLGLILVVVGGAELFTGNNLIIMAWLSGRVSSWGLLRNWSIVYVGNFVGSLATAAIVLYTAQNAMSDHAVGLQALNIAAGKLSLPWTAVLARGILCNGLVCLAVWLCYSARTTTDRIMAIVFPITAFVACGFEHCVANMYLIPAGIWAAMDPAVASLSAQPLDMLTWHNFLVHNLIPSTLGNIIGGGLMVGAVYWAAYLLPEHRRTAAQARKERSS